MRAQAVWVLRVLWFLLPLTLGQVASDAISSANHSVPQVFTVGLWALWAAAMVASMIPVPVTLTGLRIIAAGAIPLSGWALFDVGAKPLAIVAFAHAAAAGIIALNQLVGDRFVDGGSYGDERRMLLRPPAYLNYLVIPIVWAILIAAATVGPLLIANRIWIAGIGAAVIGFAIVALGIRALHQLSLRWVVFVPTGMVLHDLMVVTEPVLFRRTAVERLGPAIDGSPARDLSNGAAGLLIECELTDPAPLGLRGEGGDAAALTDVRRFLICPSRPGELLNEAERRNLPVG